MTVISEGPKSRFVKVKCEGCKNEQIIFGKAASTIKCLVCGKLLAKSSGGKAEVLSKVQEVLS